MLVRCFHINRVQNLVSLQELNAIFSKPIRELLSAEAEIDDAALISIDSKGIVIRARQGAQVFISTKHLSFIHFVEQQPFKTCVCKRFFVRLCLCGFVTCWQFNIQRLSFDGEHGVETLEEDKAALWKVIKKGQVHNLH